MALFLSDLGKGLVARNLFVVVIGIVVVVVVVVGAG